MLTTSVFNLCSTIPQAKDAALSVRTSLHEQRMITSEEEVARTPFFHTNFQLFTRDKTICSQISLQELLFHATAVWSPAHTPQDAMAGIKAETETIRF
jgi:hypothetical protein